MVPLVVYQNPIHNTFPYCIIIYIYMWNIFRVRKKKWQIAITYFQWTRTMDPFCDLHGLSENKWALTYASHRMMFLQLCRNGFRSMFIVSTPSFGHLVLFSFLIYYLEKFTDCAIILVTRMINFANKKIGSYFFFVSKKKLWLYQKKKCFRLFLWVLLTSRNVNIS